MLVWTLHVLMSCSSVDEGAGSREVPPTQSSLPITWDEEDEQEDDDIETADITVAACLYPAARLYHTLAFLDSIAIPPPTPPPEATR